MNNVTQKKQNMYRAILLAEIDTDGQNVRAKKDDDRVVELSMSMAKHGLLEPIVVRAKKDGRLQLLAGFHRLCAATRLGWPKIDANIIEDQKTPVKVIALTENVIRHNMSLEEECEAVRYLHEDDNLSPSSICDLTGKGRAWVDRRLMAPNLPEEVRAALFDNLIGVGIAEKIGGVEDEGTRNQILNQTIYQKLTASQVDGLIQIFKTSPDISKISDEASKVKGTVEKTATVTIPCQNCERERDIMDIVNIRVCRDGCGHQKKQEGK